jgi:hypothetical protein
MTRYGVGVVQLMRSEPRIAKSDCHEIMIYYDYGTLFFHSWDMKWDMKYTVINIPLHSHKITIAG